MKKSLNFYVYFYSTVEYFSNILRELSIPFSITSHEGEYIFNFQATLSEANDIDALLLTDGRLLGWYSFADKYNGELNWYKR